MRLDTTVVESNIHYPTDSGLLNGLTKKIRDEKEAQRDHAGDCDCTRPTPPRPAGEEKRQTRVAGTSPRDATDSGRQSQGLATSGWSLAASPKPSAQIMRATGCRFPIRARGATSGASYKSSDGSRKAKTWRTGCEGRISTVKHPHGLARCRYHGTSDFNPIPAARTERCRVATWWRIG